MKPPCLISLMAAQPLADAVATACGAEPGQLITDRFPDGETYLRYETELSGRDVIVLAQMHNPDDKVPALVFAAGAARDLGAASVGLAVPYLPYMRQDMAFHPGEAVTSRHFARLVSASFDWLVTIDPHLHRHASLSEIYSIPTRVETAAPLLGNWIRQSFERPLIIGPDEESAQWVRPVQEHARGEHLVLRKLRHGHSSVTITAPDLAAWRDHQPVIVDDVISTAGTMAETAGMLVAAGLRPPLCLAVHGVMAPGAMERLSRASVSRVVTTNSIPGATSEIDISGLLGAGARILLDQHRAGTQ